MYFRIILTEPFLEEYKKFFDKNELVKFYKFKEKLKSNPFIGKPLRVNFVREFKTDKGKRAYFIVYVEFNIVLFVLLSNKKNQKPTIEKLFKYLGDYYLFANYYSS